MEIRTPRLSLRTWLRADEPEMIRHVNDPEVVRGTASLPHPYSAADFAAFFARTESAQGHWHLAIDLDGAAIGGIGFHPRTGIERFTAEVGYWLGRTHWGRGYATEALRAVAERAFATTETQRLEGRVFAWNEASGRVLEKAGFTREAVTRRSAFKDGVLLDEWIYARLRGE
jgi:ribosomal-protein-alanine N-acetyltransferase